MSKDNDVVLDTLLMAWIIYQTARAEEAQDLHDDWYTVEEIADELDMDEDIVEDIVWRDDD